MTTKGSKGLRLPANRGFSSNGSKQDMKVRGSQCLGSLLSGGNILLLDYFELSRDSIESVESKANYGKTRI